MRGLLRTRASHQRLASRLDASGQEGAIEAGRSCLRSLVSGWLRVSSRFPFARLSPALQLRHCPGPGPFGYRGWAPHEGGRVALTVELTVILPHPVYTYVLPISQLTVEETQISLTREASKPGKKVELRVHVPQPKAPTCRPPSLPRHRPLALQLLGASMRGLGSLEVSPPISASH